MLLEGILSPHVEAGGGMGGSWLISVISCSCSQLGTAYVSATTGAVVTALGLKSLTKVRWPLAITGQGTWTLPGGSPWSSELSRRFTPSPGAGEKMEEGGFLGTPTQGSPSPP